MAKIRGDQAKDCSAEGSTDSGRSSNDALSQIEPTAAVRNVGSDQCCEHTDYRSADAIKQLKADKKQWIFEKGKQQRTDRQSPETDEEQRPATPASRLPSNPRSQEGNDDLR